MINNKYKCLLGVAILATFFAPSAQAQEVSTKASDLMISDSRNQEPNLSNLVAQNTDSTNIIEPGSISTYTSKLPTSNYFYGSGSVGIGSQSDVKDKDTSGSISFGTAFQLNGAVGYQWKAARAEVELGNRFFGADKAKDGNGGTVSLDGNINATTFLVNGYYDIPTGSKLRPYVGAGIGLGVNSGKISFKDQNGNTIKDENNNTIKEDIGGTAFAYQAKVGVEYEVAKKGNVFAEFKYANTGGYKLKADANVDNGEIKSFNSFGVNIGYRQGF